MRASNSLVRWDRAMRSPAEMPVWMRSMSMVPVVGSTAVCCIATCDTVQAPAGRRMRPSLCHLLQQSTKGSSSCKA